MKNKIEVQDYHVSNFLHSIVPFGSLDIRSALKTALEAGKDEDDLAEIVQNELDAKVPLNAIDIVASLYESLLQEARSEIEDLLDVDICNDSSIYVAGNYMCTSFDNYEDTKELLIEKISESEDFDFEDLSDVLTWFFSEIGLSKSDINVKDSEESIDELLS